MAIPPVEKKVHVSLDPADAFDMFTRQLARWRPLAHYSCSGADSLDVQFEARVGGAVVERTRDGARHVWGTVTLWDPSRRFAMTWHPGSPVAEATRLSVEFAAVRDGGTEVRLLHDGWENHTAARRDSYDGGWQVVLARFVAVSGEVR